LITVALGEGKMSDRILVTGAGGFIGRHLISELVDREPESTIIATDIKSEPPERYAAHIGTNVKYAIFVHEDLDAFHRTGEAKFLTKAVTRHEDRIRHLIKAGMEGKL
jgi:nucleoside-diphosphate-sugar epimerase